MTRYGVKDNGLVVGQIHLLIFLMVHIEIINLTNISYALLCQGKIGGMMYIEKLECRAVD